VLTQDQDSMEGEVRFSLAGVNERSSLIGGYLSCYRADVGPGFDGRGS
jgi:hypothetical protein